MTEFQLGMLWITHAGQSSIWISIKFRILLNKIITLSGFYDLQCICRLIQHQSNSSPINVLVLFLLCSGNDSRNKNILKKESASEIRLFPFCFYHYFHFFSLNLFFFPFSFSHFVLVLISFEIAHYFRLLENLSLFI